MRCFVRIYRYAGDYSAMVPVVPGCVAAAGSVEKVRKLITEAIALHLEMMRQSGEAIPSPKRPLEFTIDEDAEAEFCTWVEAEDQQAASGVS